MGNNISFLLTSKIFLPAAVNGQMAEWLKATDCKSVLSRVRRFEPYSAHSSFIADFVFMTFFNLNINLQIKKNYKRK